jgi:hypothetical protein
MHEEGEAVTHAVPAGAPHEVVIVSYYATLKGRDLAKVSKLAF